MCSPGDRVITACICKLVYWNRMPPLTDPTLDTWPTTICTQFIQCLSISSTCFLYLKPFLDSVETGFIRSDDLRRRGSEFTPVGPSTKMNVFSMGKVNRSKSGDTRMKFLNRSHYATCVEGGNAASRNDSESQTSRTQIIKQTRTFAVESFPDVRSTVIYPSNEVHQI